MSACIYFYAKLCYDRLAEKTTTIPLPGESRPYGQPGRLPIAAFAALLIEWHDGTQLL